jgi:DNA repair exonuclease SbcCD ATPase subunit
MKQGDFQKALDELKDLQEQLRNDELNAEEKQQLAEQLEQLQKKLQDMVDAHQQAKQDLQDEIQRKKEAGDLHEAGKLQQQLDQLNRMNDQMNQMQKMADSLGQCQECMQNGNGQGAASQLDQLADSLQDMQNQLDQLETLDEMLDDIAMAKEAMNCGMCNGQGCEACMGQGFGQGKGQGDGMGLGDGQGHGARPEEKTDTNYYDSQVRGNVQPGEAVRTGNAGGPNRAGQSLEDVKEQLRSTTSEDADPLVDVRLPRKQRDHTREYLNRIRTGQ